jgi:hypothetical protein
MVRMWGNAGARSPLNNNSWHAMFGSLSPVIPVNQMQSLIVSWRCKRFVNCLYIASVAPRLRRISGSVTNARANSSYLTICGRIN